MEVNDEFAGLVSQQVLAVWRGTAASSAAKVADTDGNQLVQRLHLDAAGIAGNARTLIELELGMEPGAFLKSWLIDHAVTAAMGEAAALTSIDQVFGRDKSGEDADHAATLLGRTPADIVGPLADKLCAEVRRWVSRRIDDPCQRLSGARGALDIINTHFVRVEAELQRIRGAVAGRLTQIRTSAAEIENPTKNAPRANVASPACLDEYFHMNLDQLTILAAEHVVRVIRAEAKAMQDEVISLGREVDQISAAVGRAATVAATAAESAYRDSPTGARQIGDQFPCESSGNRCPGRCPIAGRVYRIERRPHENDHAGWPAPRSFRQGCTNLRKAVYQALAGAAGGDGGAGRRPAYRAGDGHSRIFGIRRPTTSAGDSAQRLDRYNNRSDGIAIDRRFGHRGAG